MVGGEGEQAVAVCVLGDAIHPTGPPSSSCPDLFRASLAASSVGGWSAAWTAGYPEPVRAGPAMACRGTAGHHRTVPNRPPLREMKEDTSDTFSGRDSPGLSGIKWDSAGFHGSTGADVTGGRGRKRNPTTASSMRSTVSGERPFLGGAWPGACPAPGAALAALAAALLPREAELVGALDALENQRQAGELFRRHGLLALAEFGHGGERHRPQGLDQDEPRAALGRSPSARTHISLARSVSCCWRIRSRTFLV